MTGKLSELVSGEAVAMWLLIAFLVFYFIYKEWPEFKKRMTSGVIKEQKDEQIDKTVDQRLNTIESNIKEIDGKLDRDYQRLNRLDSELEHTRDSQKDMAEELGLIMEALMGALGGLQELGANGPTKEAKNKIQDYLNRKAHQSAYGGVSKDEHE